MYCFSQICRICLSSSKTEFINVYTFDNDNVKINDKLIFCVPEIVCTQKNLPELICSECYAFVKQMHNFKQMCIENTETLYKHVSKLSDNALSSNIKSDLFVKIDVDKDIENYNQREITNNCTNGFSEFLEKSSSEGTSMYSISLNQWDLFETKFTCRCIKEFSSFTENTEHLCKNCEGELLGFRLSKIKVGNAESRYNKSLETIDYENEDSDSDLHFTQNELNGVENNDSSNYERGFDYNDILLCKVHVNGVKKQINILRNITDNDYNDDSIISENNTTISSNNISLQDRKKTENSKVLSITRYHCTLCDKSYARKYNLLAHFITHKGTKLIDCPNCSQKFISTEDLEQHGKTHIEIFIKKEVSSCDSTLTEQMNSDSDTEQIFSKPDLNSSDENLVCGTCDKTFSHKSNLAIHLMTHFGKKEYKCSICNKEFFRKENLDEHAQIHMSDRKYQCPSCEKSYNHKSNLRRHMHSHREDKYLCSICNKQFVKKDVLEQHIFDAHSKQKVKKEFVCMKIDNQYFCKICNKAFTHLINLKMHSLSHSRKNKKNHDSLEKSSIEKRTFDIKTNIEKHMMKHRGVSNHACKQCDMKFESISLLRQHVTANHNAFIKYTCNLCNKNYVSKSNLKRHVMLHTK